jgi:hypothetical protein
VTNNPYGEAPPPADPPPSKVKGWVVAIGIVLGLVVTVVWMTTVFATAYSFTAETGRSSGVADVLIFVLFIAPLPLSILLLCFRRTRQMAAGLVMGMAIGTLALAGLCGSLILPSLTA